VLLDAGLSLGVVTAIVLALSSLARTFLFAVVVGALAVVAGQLQWIAQDAVLKPTDSVVYEAFLWVSCRLIPNLQQFNIGDALVLGSAGVPAGAVATVALSGLFYMVAYLFVGALIFLVIAVFPDTVCDRIGIDQRAELGDLFEARLLVGQKAQPILLNDVSGLDSQFLAIAEVTHKPVAVTVDIRTVASRDDHPPLEYRQPAQVVDLRPCKAWPRGRPVDLKQSLRIEALSS
jgi:hypothetical protein